MPKSNVRSSGSRKNQRSQWSMMSTEKRRPVTSRKTRSASARPSATRSKSTTTTTTSKRGFAAMSPQKRKQIAAKGGRARRTA
ncbi:MAG: hypothetical protein NDJ90_12905 [Oligoflexia bacterium]|nr:hypothetical protein [Oligoflexia bacterium]